MSCLTDWILHYIKTYLYLYLLYLQPQIVVIFVPSFLFTFFQQGVIVISTGADADYHYLVTVITGWQRNAGTSATIAMDMVGSLGVIDTLVLAEPTRCVHESGAETWFLVATDETLGELSELRVWHDCSGIFPSWFVTTVYHFR